MRFTEIFSPEDQLALWRLITDRVWATFGELPLHASAPKDQAINTKPITKQTGMGGVHVSAKSAVRGKAPSAKGHKPKRAPMAPAPKPLPKPQHLQPTATQAKQVQTQQNHQLVQQIHQALNKKAPAPTRPQAVQPKPPVPTTVAPMNNSYSERDKDDLVFHRRENPFKPLNDQKSLY